jgi:chromosome segregation protein
MEQADQLYGVVMQESGVSQILSVSLKDLKDEV